MGEGSTAIILVCKGVTRKSAHCKLAAVGADGYCWLHSPANVQQRKEITSKAGRAGGRSRAKQRRLSAFESLWQAADELDKDLDAGGDPYRAAVKVNNRNHKIAILKAWQASEEGKRKLYAFLSDYLQSLWIALQRTVQDRNQIRTIGYELQSIFEERTGLDLQLMSIEDVISIAPPTDSDQHHQP